MGLEGSLFRTHLIMKVTLFRIFFEESLAVLRECRRLDVCFEAVFVLEAPFYILTELFGQYIMSVRDT